MKTKFAALFAVSALLCGSEIRAEDAVRNFGATTVSDIAPAGSALPTATVAFGHHRRGCCGGKSYSAAYGSYGLTPGLYNAYNTYQPYGGGYTSYYPGTTANNLGLYGAGVNFGPGYYGAAGPGIGRYIDTPNPYGYYQNGQIWGSSGPTYARPVPVWDSPSGRYDYRYNGWGSYGWGGWGGTGPAGWGYQGGFYW